MYEFRGTHIPDYMMPAVKRYVDHGEIPGHFLQSVICNDLRGTIMYADDENVKNIAAYVGYFHNEVPGNAWGDHKTMLAWADDGGLLGRE